MADLHRRLLAQGFPVSTEPHVFTAATAKAVRGFQEHRGLHVDGICGPQTWGALVEAGYRLGDRLLYLRQPLTRGDDVADLQRRLGSLGFNAGRADGIFGRDTEQGLRSFQRNAGLAVDGVCGAPTVRALRRLRSRGPDADAAAVRETLRWETTPPTLAGRHLVVAERGGVGALAREVQRVLTAHGAFTTSLSHPDASVLASQANAAGAELYVGLALAPVGQGCGTAYWGAHGATSPAGRQLAGFVLDELAAAGAGVDGAPRPMATPALRETRMPAVIVDIGPPRFAVEQAALAADSIGRAVKRWVSGLCLDDG